MAFKILVKTKDHLCGAELAERLPDSAPGSAGSEARGIGFSNLYQTRGLVQVLGDVVLRQCISSRNALRHGLYAGTDQD